MDLRESKTKLRSQCVELQCDKPAYNVVSTEWDDPDRCGRKLYTVRVFVDGFVDCTGQGMSRRLAEYRAAENALIQIAEVREEQQKSTLGSNPTPGTSGIGNGGSASDTGAGGSANGDDDKQTNGELKDNNGNNDSANNSTIITADINQTNNDNNTIGAETTGAAADDTHQQLNGNRRRSTPDSDNHSSSDASNDGKNDNGTENGHGKTNGNNSTPTTPTTGVTPTTAFRKIVKTSVQLLQEYCVKVGAALPFYDTTYREGMFANKCHIELPNADEVDKGGSGGADGAADDEADSKTVLTGAGSGLTSKEAKLKAADDVLRQLTELGLVN